jgi:4-hydroxy-tetrahydrodipicolinate synthase
MHPVPNRYHQEQRRGRAGPSLATNLQSRFRHGRNQRWRSQRTGATLGEMVGRPPVFTGIGVALITVFTQNGDLNSEATAAHAAWLVDEGVRAVVIAGTTGEAMTLDPDERSRLLKDVGGAVRGRVPLIAGTGAPSARQASWLSRRAAADGADAVLALSPPGVPDPRAYYEQIAASIDIPLLAYHYPQVSAPGVPIDALSDLPVDGLKDSSGDAERLILQTSDAPAGLYTGQHSLLLLAGRIGCSGAILALANLDVQSCERAWQGDPDAQCRVVSDHSDVRSIAALKDQISALRGTNPTTRLG